MTDISSFLPDEDKPKRIVRLYTTKSCTKCPQVRAWLSKNDIGYDEVDMSTGKWMAELRFNEVFVLSAPVLQIDDRFFTSLDMFVDDQLHGLDILLGIRK